jgi:dTMP kinase
LTEKPANKGPFIVLDGCDGAGKTTQARMLSDALRQPGRDVLALREPGGTRLGEALRHILLDPTNDEICLRAEVLLYSACRAQLIDEKLLPALAEGSVVICDRYYYATVAYQGYGGGESPEDLYELSRYTTGGLEPDVAFILDLTPEDGLRRLATSPDRIEARGIEYFHRVRKGFKEIAARDPERFVIVDAMAPTAQVHLAILEELKKRFAL